MDKDKVLDKVRKLLSLGRDGGATEHEQEAALSKAAALLAEHGLTESQIDSAEFKVDRKEVVVGLGQWKGVLAMATANLYGAFVTKDKSAASMMFYGPTEVVEAAAMTYEWLIDQINMMRNAAVKSDPNVGGSTWGNNFKSAAASRIYSRVGDILKGQTQAGTGTALVLHTNHLQTRTKEILDSQGHKFGKGAKQNLTIRSMDAWAAGKRAGDSVQLNKNVS